jgi:hypothetical protein
LSSATTEPSSAGKASCCRRASPRWAWMGRPTPLSLCLLPPTRDAAPPLPHGCVVAYAIAIGETKFLPLQPLLYILAPFSFIRRTRKTRFKLYLLWPINYPSIFFVLSCKFYMFGFVIKCTF